MSLSAHTVLEQYEILAPLGAGGMGEVYRARDRRLNREVAIKVLPTIYATNPDRLRWFEKEARAAAALNHPNILAVYELGNHEGTPYLVSELLEGETLRERLKRGALPVRKVVQHGIQIARGLAAAHDKGIVHRDLKPENLFLTKDGQVKILDFGLAHMVEEAESTGTAKPINQDRTDPELVVGTPSYMSPEQVKGRGADQRSDIFAFSAILQEMITGRRVFRKGTPPETMAAILNDEPQPIAQLVPSTPVALQRLILRGLEKNPEQRFQSASDLAFALEALTDVTLMTRPMHALPAERPRWVKPAIVGGGLLLLLLLTGGAYLLLRPEPVPTVGQYTQLTHDGLQKTVIGTDGVRLYMTLMNSGMQDVATISTAGGQQADLAMPGPNMTPVDVAPGGSEFLLVDGQGFPPVGPLWSLPAMNGSPRRLGETIGDSAAWSPDGKSLAFANGGSVYVADPDGNDPRKILELKSLIADLRWSPDGKRLSFDIADVTQVGNGGTGVGQQTMWEVEADGSNPHPMLGAWHSASGECCGRWTRDGKYFVFQSQGQIWALGRTSGFLQGVPKPIQLTSSPMSLHSPVPSLDGKKLFFVGRTYRGELTRWDLKTHVPTQFLGGLSAEWLNFSKDGQWVAYVAYPEATLWKSRLDGSGKVQLTFPPVRPVLPRWSPDGKWLLFFEFPNGPGKPGHMFEISADGGTPRELLPNDAKNQQDANWSPDGSKIVFAGDANDATVGGDTPQIRILDVSTGEVSYVPGSKGLYSPRWSPDGKQIAAMTGDSATLMVYDMATQKWTALAKGTFGWLNWSKDGRYLYVKDFAGKGSVDRVSVSDHRLEKVINLAGFADTGQGGGSLALAPDDSPLLLRDTGTQDVYAVDWDER